MSWRGLQPSILRVAEHLKHWHLSTKLHVIPSLQTVILATWTLQSDTHIFVINSVYFTQMLLGSATCVCHIQTVTQKEDGVQIMLKHVTASHKNTHMYVTHSLDPTFSKIKTGCGISYKNTKYEKQKYYFTYSTTILNQIHYIQWTISIL
jgi:hypothetical protein